MRLVASYGSFFSDDSHWKTPISRLWMGDSHWKSHTTGRRANTLQLDFQTISKKQTLQYLWVLFCRFGLIFGFFYSCQSQIFQTIDMEIALPTLGGNSRGKLSILFTIGIFSCILNLKKEKLTWWITLITFYCFYVPLFVRITSFWVELHGFFPTQILQWYLLIPQLFGVGLWS